MDKIAELRAKHPDALFIFRKEESNMYEIQGEDAQKAAEVTGLVLSRHTTDRTLFCAFKSFELDKYLPMLIRVKFRVAICDNIK